MSRFAILRIEKRTPKKAREMAQHALRDGPAVSNADATQSMWNRVLVGPQQAKDVMTSIKTALPAKPRSNAVLVVEALVTFSPEIAHEWPQAKQHAYLEESLAWIAARFGGMGNIKSAVVHVDETTPHLQILLVPLDDGFLRANKFIGGPPGLRKLQTLFADEVGAPYGLSRGLQRPAGSPRITHQAVQRFYTAIGDDDGAKSLTPEQTVYWAKVGRMFAGHYGRGLHNRSKELLRLAKEQGAALARLQAEVSDAALHRDRLLSDNAVLTDRAASLASAVELMESQHRAIHQSAPTL